MSPPSDTRRLLPAALASPLAQVGPGDFDRAVRMLHDRTGILLGRHKREMAERKLGIHARNLGLKDTRSYLDILESDPNSVFWKAFVNAFTINHTAFFREPHHFGVLAEYASERKNDFSVWSCACSTGEEAYSIAMTLCETRSGARDGLSVLATDVDTDALSVARGGVYVARRATGFPVGYLPKYFLRGVGRQAGMIRAKPFLRATIEFGELNLMSAQWPRKTFDAIFCRNTMIYFDRATQERMLDRFARMLKPEGLLFAGHSENFTHMTTAFRLQGQTVYTVAR